MSKKIAEQFLEYVNKTGSPQHSVKGLKQLLNNKQFQQVKEGTQWNIKPGGKYYFTRNYTTIVAFIIGEQFDVDKSGFLTVCAHTDSPVLHLRPNCNVKKQGILQLGVECYGGGLWQTWFDRGLGVAGKVIVKEGEGMSEKLVHIKKPIALIPSLPIHLRSADESFNMKINKETHLNPMTATQDGHQFGNFENTHISPVIIKSVAKELSCKEEDILDVDLCLMDATDSRFCGYEDEFIESPRLDNLASTYTTFAALADSADQISQQEDIYIAAGFDHEEIGSMSFTGAFSSLMKCTLDNILSELDVSANSFYMSPRSFIVSSDMGHAYNPNYPEKYQSEHLLHPNKGVALKMNASQKYATTNASISIFTHLAKKHNIKVQPFVVRNDLPCGSTVGPMLSASLGTRTIDIGTPQWAMHSIRESCATNDLVQHYNLIKAFYQDFKSVDSNFKPYDE